MDYTEQVNFIPVHLHTNVTCIRIIANHVFAGIGGYLNMFDANDNRLVNKQKVFQNDVIFDVKPSSKQDKLIVYGQKSISILSLHGENLELDQAEEHSLTDWILCAQWTDNDTQFVTVSMHNQVTLWAQDFRFQKSVVCEVKCLVLSAYICFNNWNEMLVLSGTVFNEILLWKPSCVDPRNGLSQVMMTLKKHNGVIFCIDVDLHKGLICSTSDDRSAVLWSVANPEILTDVTASNCNQLQLAAQCQVYGHTSRVFKCLILKASFATGGEDSSVILWTFNGVSLRKLSLHQGGPVWALGYHSEADFLYSGGSDGGLLKCNPHCAEERMLMKLPAAEQPKHVAILNSGSILCMSENGTLYQTLRASAEHPDLKKYCLLQVSPCRKLVSLAGYEGQIYIYGEGHGKLRLLCRHFLPSRSRILAVHWLDCKRFLVLQGRSITMQFMHQEAVHQVGVFELPAGPKGRFTTCACSWGRHVIVGDSVGHVYSFLLGRRGPVQVVKRAHNHLGVTGLYADGPKVTSLGKNGFVKEYAIDPVSGHLECTKSHRTNFGWLTALDRRTNHILSFSGNTFRVSQVQSGVVVEALCGGGHRSWDWLSTPTSLLTFAFIKHRTIHKMIFDLNSYKPVSLIQGCHSRVINCLRLVGFDESLIMVSGGEDTTLRITAITPNNSSRTLECRKVHLSSIRALHLHELAGCKDQLLVSAGGRAQIICWHLQIVSESRVSCTEKYNFYEPLSRDEGETRIMDLNTARSDSQLSLFAGCSTGFIKIFRICTDLSLEYQRAVLHSHHSITKLACVAQRQLLTSMATDGTVSFWPVSSLSEQPSSSYVLHQSGINSFSCFLLKNKLVVLTGGDDNCVTLSLFLMDTGNRLAVSQLDQIEDKSLHCAQITGAFLSHEYAVTSSIDQRIVLSKWACWGDQLKMIRLASYSTTVTDLQGLEVVFGHRLCVYGEGFEILKVTVPICASRD